jgi:hypothetical protein
MENKLYTIGEIAREGLLKKRDGTAQTNRSLVSRMIRELPYTRKKTPFGYAKLYDKRQLDLLNELNKNEPKN